MLNDFMLEIRCQQIVKHNTKEKDMEAKWKEKLGCVLSFIEMLKIMMECVGYSKFVLQ